MTYSYEFAQASPCRAVVGYTLQGNKFDLLTTFCDASVDGGRSNMAGGFDEIGKFLQQPANTIMDGDEELYRECKEELGDEFENIIPYADFHERVEALWDGKRRVGDSQIVHAITQKSLRLTQQEMDAIAALPSTAERIGFKVESFMLDSFNGAADAEAQVRDRLSDYRHKVEQDAAVRLVKQIMKRELGIAA